jgi:hypothetical protein
MAFASPAHGALGVVSQGSPTPGANRAPAKPPAPNPEDMPIVVPPYPYLAKDLQKREDAWYDRNMIEPFLSQIPDGKPWKNAAKDYIKAAVHVWQVQQTSFKRVMTDGKSLIAQGCDDPLVSILVQYFRCYSGDHEGVGDAAQAAFARMDREKHYPAAVVRMAGMAANNILQVTASSRSVEIDQRVVDLTKDSMLAGDYKGEDDCLFLRHTLAWPWGWDFFTNNYEGLAAVFPAAAVPDWIQHTLKGYIEVKRAWDRRGPGYANTVTPEGWMGFNDRYNVARDEYTAGWKLHPTRPEAASEMIGITMAGHGHPGDTMRLWFDRAVAAQFDYIQAYDAMAWGLRPRWGGSVKRMLHFARLCAETRQFDTEVPSQFFRIIDNATEEEDWRKVYRSPIVSDLVVPTAMGIADSPVRRPDWKQQYSRAAVEAYLVGDGVAAADALNKAGGTLASSGRDLLYQRGGDMDAMKREIAVLQTPAGPDYWKGEQLYDQGNLDGATGSFNQCAAKLKAASDPLEAVPLARAEALQVEKDLASGGWQKIPLDPGIWHFQGGNWKTSQPGCLEIDGPGKAIAYATPRIGQTFELRGDIEVTCTDKQESSVAVLLGEHGTGYFVTCGFKQNRGIDILQASATDRWDESTGSPEGVPVQTPDSFLIHVENGQVTYQLNGRPVAADYRAGSSPLNKAHSRIGLAARSLHPGTIVRFTKLEARTVFDP